jgi:hypothetical protein
VWVLKTGECSLQVLEGKTFNVPTILQSTVAAQKLGSNTANDNANFTTTFQPGFGTVFKKVQLFSMTYYFMESSSMEQF